MPIVAKKVNSIIKENNINILHIRSRAPAWLLPFIDKKNLTTVSTFHNVYGHQNTIKKLYNNVGLFRNEKDLKNALKQVEEWIEQIKNMGIGDKSRIYNTNLKEFLEFKNMLDISKEVIKSAILRKESRGAHYRIDYPKESKEFISCK